jgi:hypothetical protein
MMLHRQIEWYNIMVSSQQSHTWDQGHSICLQHHGLFSPTLFMRLWTTLSVYTTSWSHRVVPGLMYGIGEKRPWCCIDRQSGPWSHVWDWWEETMMYMRPGTTLSAYSTPWSLLTNSIHETMDHSICLYNIMVSSHQSSMVSWMGLVRRDHDVV